MKYLMPVALIMLSLAGFAVAVTVTQAPKSAAGFVVVSACGTLPAPAPVAGQVIAGTIDPTGKLCTSQ